MDPKTHRGRPWWQIALIASALILTMLYAVWVAPTSRIVWAIVLFFVIFCSVLGLSPQYKYWRRAASLYAIAAGCAIVPELQLVFLGGSSGALEFASGPSPFMAVAFLCAASYLSWLDFRQSNLTSQESSEPTIPLSIGTHAVQLLSGVTADTLVVQQGVPESVTLALIDQNANLTEHLLNRSTEQATIDSDIVWLLIEDFKTARRTFEFKKIEQLSPRIKQLASMNASWSPVLSTELKLLVAEQEKAAIAQQREKGNELDFGPLKSVLAELNNEESLHQADQRGRLVALNAFVISIEKSVDAAVALIDQLDEPAHFYALVFLLTFHDRFQDVADLTANKPLNSKWADLAVYSAVAIGQPESAIRLLSSAIDVCESWAVIRCRIAFAESTFAEVLKEDPRMALSVRQSITDSDRALLTHAINVLAPLVQQVKLQSKIETSAQQIAIDYSARAYGLLGQLFQLADLSAPLLATRPISLVGVQLVLRGVCNAPPDLVARVRTDHADNFSAHLLAAIVEREVFVRREQAFAALLRLVTWALNEGDEASDALAGAIFETSTGIGPSKLPEAKETVGKLLGQENQFNLFFDVLMLEQHESPAAALNLLKVNEREDDGVWWQLVAQLHETLGHIAESEIAWQKACELMPHPNIVNHFAGIIVEQKRYQEAVALLESARQNDPENSHLIKKLAFAYVSLLRFADSVPLFEQLLALEPSQISHHLNLAVCLARSGSTNRALEILEQIADAGSYELSVAAVKCNILIGMGESKKAFKILSSLRPAYWKDADFLLLYMTIGYRAGEDELANEAFQQIHEMQSTGKLSKPVFQSMSVEDLMKLGGYEREKRRFHIQQYLNSKMPWLLIDQRSRIPAFRAFASRTQDLRWLSDDPISRAEYTIYATNGYVLFREQDGKTNLADVSSSKPASAVVADMSALITFFYLGQLENAVKFFGKVIVPASYHDLALREAEQLSPHQPRTKQELEAIRTAIDSNNIRVVVDTHSSPHNQFVDEYGDDSSNTYRLIDLFHSLESDQVLSSQELTELAKICRHDPMKTPALNLKEVVQFDLATLRAISLLPWFHRILPNMRWVISKEDYNALNSELLAYAWQDSIFRDHSAFWNELDRLSSFIEFAPSQLEDIEASDHGEEHESCHLDAVTIAVNRQYPLLADDRFCQCYFSFMTADAGQPVYTTYSVLCALQDAGSIGIDSLAEGMRKLMRWRYRFIIPLPVCLKSFADHSRSNLPGPELLEAAVYIQENFRDPGILCGMEKTDPPVSMALRLFMDTLRMCAEFLQLVWEDPNYTFEEQEGITRWCIRRLLPSLPRGLLYNDTGRQVSERVSHAFLSTVMVRFAMINSIQHANSALRIIADELDADDDIFYRAAAEVADDKPFRE
jgi:tetratricopeptide (TPR) repeat protein